VDIVVEIPRLVVIGTPIIVGGMLVRMLEEYRPGDRACVIL
jgi:hypothetical protein